MADPSKETFCIAERFCKEIDGMICRSPERDMASEKTAGLHWQYLFMASVVNRSR